jgi:hypothetical protein
MVAATAYSVWRLLRDGRLRGRSSIPGRVKNFNFRLDLGSTQSPTQWVRGALSAGVKWQECDAGHSPPISAVVKTRESIPPIPHMTSWAST